ncbi:hypothetical protein IMSAG025_00843 [Muribaculaceae bacterium]|nr:hypothetical protein IMSAG025_00843 [Muribaculaceae bacterium]
MYDVHYHCYSPLVRVIDKAFEVIGCAEAGGCGVEAADVISERPVIRVFLDRHYLDRVISVGSDAGKCLGAELLVCADLLLFLCHAYVAFINKKRFCVGIEFLYLEFVRHLRRVDFCRENMGVRILYHSCCIRRDSLAASAFPFDSHFIKVAVPDEIGREMRFPDSSSDRGE